MKMKNGIDFLHGVDYAVAMKEIAIQEFAAIAALGGMAILGVSILVRWLRSRNKPKASNTDKEW